MCKWSQYSRVMAQLIDRRRSGCPISFALDILGDKWTLLVLRDLLLNGKRYYREFLEAGENIATNILADRLKRLEAEGLLTKDRDQDNRKQVIYQPTKKSLALLPVLIEVAYWGATHDPKTAAPRDFVRTTRRDRDAIVVVIRKQFSAIRRGSARQTSKRKESH